MDAAMSLTLRVLLLVSGFQAYSVLGQSPECNADIFFVLDSSTSIHVGDFKKQLQFVEDVADKVNFGTKDKVHIGILTFSSGVRNEISLGQYRDKVSFNRAVRGIRQMYGNTMTHLALQSMMRVGFRNARPEVPHIGIVITDGESTEPRQTRKVAKVVHDTGYTMFAIGVGTKIDYNELDTIASKPLNKHRFKVDQYSALQSIKDKLAEETCLTTTPRPTPAPCQADVVFSIPEQAGVQDTNNYISFISELSKHVDISPQKVQMGITKQVYDTRGGIRLKDSPDGNELRNRLNMLRPRGDRIELVLNQMRTERMKAPQGARQQSVKIAILVEDNRLAFPQETIEEANKAKNSGIKIVILGVGSRVEPNYLRQVASPDVFFPLSDSNAVAKLAEKKYFQMAMNDLFCTGDLGNFMLH